MKAHYLKRAVRDTMRDSTTDIGHRHPHHCGTEMETSVILASSLARKNKGEGALLTLDVSPDWMDVGAQVSTTLLSGHSIKPRQSQAEFIARNACAVAEQVKNSTEGADELFGCVNPGISRSVR